LNDIGGLTVTDKGLSEINGGGGGGSGGGGDGTGGDDGELSGGEIGLIGTAY
jgi:hypothetical protein